MATTAERKWAGCDHIKDRVTSFIFLNKIISIKICVISLQSCWSCSLVGIFFLHIFDDESLSKLCNMSEDDDRFVVRCRGLPWSTTVEEIKNFFEGVNFKEGKCGKSLIVGQGSGFGSFLRW